MMEELSIKEKDQGCLLWKKRVSVTAEFSTNQELKRLRWRQPLLNSRDLPLVLPIQSKAALFGIQDQRGVAAADVDEKVELAAMGAAMVAKLIWSRATKDSFSASGEKPKMTV
jgi:hypothetical protein